MPQVNELSWVSNSFKSMMIFLILMLLIFFLSPFSLSSPKEWNFKNFYFNLIF